MTSYLLECLFICISNYF